MAHTLSSCRLSTPWVSTRCTVENPQPQPRKLSVTRRWPSLILDAGRIEVRITHPADAAARFAPSVAVRPENMAKQAAV